MLELLTINMRIILKYKYHILGILILAGIGYFVLLNKSSKIPISDPATYGVTVTQTGGISSNVTTAQVLDLTSKTYTSLNPPESYMSVSFKDAGYLTPFGGEPDWVVTSSSMWAYCKNGYVVTDAKSPTNNPIDNFLIGVPEYGAGIEILNKPNNIIQITCGKQ